MAFLPNVTTPYGYDNESDEEASQLYVKPTGNTTPMGTPNETINEKNNLNKSNGNFQ